MNVRNNYLGSGEKEIRKEIQRLKANIDSQLSKLRNNLEASVASCCKPIIPDELPVSRLLLNPNVVLFTITDIPLLNHLIWSRISSEKHSLVPMLKAKREKVLEQMTNLTDKILTLKENMDSQRLKLMELLKAARIQLQQSRLSDSSSSSAADEQPSALQRTAEHFNRR